MKPIVCAAFAAAFVTAVLANDDPLPAAPVADEKPSAKPAAPAHSDKKAPGHGHEVHWTYSGDTGPEHWSDLQKEFSVASHGTRQSPIDIITKDTKETDLGAIQFHYNPHSEFEVRNNGHTLRVNVTSPEGQPENLMTIGKNQYKLLQFHFHAKSEHTINGKHSPMEMHLVHQLVEHHEDGHGKPVEQNLAVIGVMIRQLTDDTKDQTHSNFIQKVWQVLPLVNEETPKTGKSVSLHDMQPEGLLPSVGHRSYYRYSGSLTTPPCTESVTWTVLADPVYYTKKQIDDFGALPFFHKIGGKNNRPVQPLKARSVLRYQDHPHAPPTIPAPSVGTHSKPKTPAPSVDTHSKPGGAGHGHSVGAHDKPTPTAHPTASHGKPSGAVLNEILHKGKLPTIGNGDGPFSGKLTLMGDDGKKHEVTYKDGQVVARTEWQESGAVRVESEFSHGVEIKRTGWRGDKKWFEIEFTVDEAPAGHGKPVPPLAPTKHGTTNGHGAPAKHGTTDGHGAPAKHGTTDGHGAPAKHGTTDGHGAPAKHGTTDGHGAPAKNGTADGHGAPAKHGTTDGHGTPAKHGVTDTHGTSATHGPTGAHGSTVNTVATKPERKWPAFVPGTPNFPAAKTPPSGDHESDQSHERSHSASPTAHGAPNANTHGSPTASAPDAHGTTANTTHDSSHEKPPTLPKMETRPTKPVAKTGVTPAIQPVPKSVGPAAELRADHLVYVRGSALPYTGKTTLLDENGKKTYEGGFLRGRREGPGVEWYATGEKKSEGEFRAGSFYEGNLYWYFIGTAQKKMHVKYSTGKVVEAHLWNRNGSLRW